VAGGNPNIGELGKNTRFGSGLSAVECGAKGGRATRKKKTMSAIASMMVNAQLSGAEKEKIKKKYGLSDEDDMIVASAMIAGQIQSAIKGDSKAFNAVNALAKEQEEKEEKESKQNERRWTIPPTDLTKDFVEPYRAVHDAFDGDGTREIISKGGRGSIKSNFWSSVAYETILQDNQAHVVFTRRYKVDLRGSVYNQFMKVVIRYDDLENWEFKQSPLCAIYKPTGQMVMFVGADKPISLKSFNVPFGYVKLLIHEECDEMAGLEQMDNIEDTFLRSDTPALDVKVFNPPKSKNNFMNEYTEQCEHKEGTKVFHSYYFNVPIKWLGQRFFDRARWFEKNKPLYYKNNYLGEVTGTGGGIFENVEVRQITDAEIDCMPFFYRGLDFGFEHPQVFEKAYYCEDTDTLYCVEEVYSKRCKNSSFARKIKKHISDEIICDSARPDEIAEMQDWGFNAVGAKKRWGTGKGRDYCWEWLQMTTKIVIDHERCPHLKHELTTLEHEQLADGSFSDAYPKVGEDCTMALIYGLNRVIMESRRNDGLYDDFSDDDNDYEEDEEE